MTRRRGPESGKAVERSDTPPKEYYDIAPDGCWVWNRAKSKLGYGSTRYGGRYVGAHRAYYAHFVAPIPAGMVVMHTCDNRSCVNPDHLTIGTQGENQRDMRDKLRSPYGVTHVSTRLTPNQVWEIRRRYDAGEPRQGIADDHGISMTAVWRIGKRIHWRHLPEKDAT